MSLISKHVQRSDYKFTHFGAVQIGSLKKRNARARVFERKVRFSVHKKTNITHMEMS